MYTEVNHDETWVDAYLLQDLELTGIDSNLKENDNRDNSQEQWQKEIDLFDFLQPRNQQLSVKHEYGKWSSIRNFNFCNFCDGL